MRTNETKPVGFSRRLYIQAYSRFRDSHGFTEAQAVRQWAALGLDERMRLVHLEEEACAA